LLGQARQALARRDEVAAASILQRALSLAPNDPRVHLGFANFHFERGSLEAAQRSAQRAVALRPGGIAELLLLGQIHYKQGDRDLACTTFLEVLRLQPNQQKAQHYVSLARCR